MELETLTRVSVIQINPNPNQNKEQDLASDQTCAKTNGVNGYNLGNLENMDKLIPNGTLSQLSENKLPLRKRAILPQNSPSGSSGVSSCAESDSGCGSSTLCPMDCSECSDTLALTPGGSDEGNGAQSPLHLHTNIINYSPIGMDSDHTSTSGSQRSRSHQDVIQSPTGQRPTSGENSNSVSPNGTSKSGSGRNKSQKLCDVCGDVAKSLHFGGLSCDSCKAFFRRSVHKDAYLQFSCGYDGACQITKQTRKACQKCRFEKCIRIGMEMKWVMSEEERSQLNKQRIEKKKQQDSSPKSSSTSANSHRAHPPSKDCDGVVPTAHSTSSTSLIYSSPTEDSPEYYPSVDNMLEYMTLSEKQTIQEVCELYRLSYVEIPYSVPKTSEGQRHPLEVIGMFTTILRRFAYFSKLLPDFKDLSRVDQKNLLKASVLEMCLLRGALSFDIQNHRWPNTNLEFLVNCPRLNVEDMQNLVSPELFQMHMTFIRNMQKHQVDEPTVMLLLLIVMFYPERAELELDDPERVAQAQEKYCALLKKYLSWRFGPMGPKLYPKLLTQLTDLRQLNDLHTEYNMNLQKEEVDVIKNDMAMLNLDPYPQWKILESKEGKGHDPKFPNELEPGHQNQHLPTATVHPQRSHHHRNSARAHAQNHSHVNGHLNHLQAQRNKMREAFLRKIPQLIDDPFGPLMTEQEIQMAIAHQLDNGGMGMMGNMMNSFGGLGALNGLNALNPSGLGIGMGLSQLSQMAGLGHFQRPNVTPVTPAPQGGQNYTGFDPWQHRHHTPSGPMTPSLAQPPPHHRSQNGHQPQQETDEEVEVDVQGQRPFENLHLGDLGSLDPLNASKIQGIMDSLSSEMRMKIQSMFQNQNETNGDPSPLTVGAIPQAVLQGIYNSQKPSH